MAQPIPSDILASLLGLLAHDLRNPLSALQSNVGYLMSALAPTGREDQEALQDALVSCDNLLNLIDTLELLSQLLRGENKLQTEPVGIGAVVADVVARHRALAASHAAVLHMDASAQDERLRARVNRAMYARALANLLRNSIQYSPSGAEVLILGRRQQRSCQLIVADSGPSLAEQYAAEAFSAEGQLAAKGRSEARYGRGLGLYCAQAAAQLAGAEVKRCDPVAPATNAFQLCAPCR